MVHEDKVTRANAILAKCHECCGYYGDDKDDCGVTACSLYTWMPYRKRTPNLEWTGINPKIKGQVTWEDCARDITDEQRQAMAERLKTAREKRASNDDEA